MVSALVASVMLGALMAWAPSLAGAADGDAVANMVKDINPGSADSAPQLLVHAGNTLMFKAFDPAFGRELQKTDGTGGGTGLVKDISPGGNNSLAGTSAFSVAGHNVFFPAFDGSGGVGNEPYKSDGTAAGTILLKDINPGSASSVASTSSSNYAGVGNTMFFGATDGSVAPAHGRELWKSDGTPAGTVLVKDIKPGTSNSLSALPNLTALGNTLLFQADDGVNGTELWKSDGTEAGTVMVKDIAPGTFGSPETGFTPYSSFPANFAVAGATAYFGASDGLGTELWKTDGTEAGTVRVSAPGTLSIPQTLTVVGNSLYFRAYQSSDPEGDRELWRSDGTEAGTVRVKDIAPGFASSSPTNLTPFGDKLLFQADDGTHGPELWVTDGTEVGTVMLGDINAGSSGSSPSNFGMLGTTAYFSATDATYGTELWKTDGTPGGTVLAQDINPGTGSSTPQFLTPFNGMLFFSASDGTTGSAHGTELWRLRANFAPLAVADTYTTPQDSTLTVAAPGVLANDTDANADPLTAGSATTPAHGNVTLNADGSFSYTPVAGFTGTDSFTYVANDGLAPANSPGTVTITVAGANNAPVGADDTYSTNENVALSVPAPGVLANDSDADDDTLNAASASTPAHGAVALHADGSFTYTPATNFNGSDSFTYVTSDGHGATATATATISVAAVNNPPTPAADTYSTNSDTPLTIEAPGVLGNDSDPDADPLSAGSASTAAHGSIALAADGSFTYTPEAGFFGSDSFTYVVSDPSGATATATVNIGVVGEGSVSTVKASACGYRLGIGLFGGPQIFRGCGTGAAPSASSYSPEVALPVDGSGSPTAVAATDADGAIGDVGPAFVFTGRWPWEVNNAPPSGPISASAEGTPADGSVIASVDIALYPSPRPMRCYGEPAGTTNCEAPGGFGPSPVEGDSLHVECSAAKDAVSGTTHLTNAQLTTSTLAGGAPGDVEAVPDDPPVNYTRQGKIDNLGEHFTVVYNEQIWHPDGSLTVNAVHLYMFGPTAVGGLIVGQVICATNPAPVPPPDTAPPTCGAPAVAVLHPEDPTPRVPRSEFVGVFDTSGVQSIDNVVVTNGTVQVGDPSSTQEYQRFTPGQTGPLRIVATRTDESLPMRWSFDATDVAGNTIHCTGVDPSVPTVSASPASVTAGNPVTTTWSNITSPGPTDWVGLYPSGSTPDPGLVAWAYTNGTAAGSLNLTVPAGSPPGATYELRLFTNNSYERLATSAPFSVVASATTVSASPASVIPGGTVTATYSGIAVPSATDWVGLYDSSSTPDAGLVAWAFTNGTGAGSLNLVVPAHLPPGTTYELRLFTNNTYTRMATSAPFSVVASSSSVSASPSTVIPGGSVTATYSGVAAPTATDWVGLYDSSSTPNPGLLAWAYTNGSAAGSLNLAVPAGATPGATYELRLFTANSYTRLATSAPFSVVASSAAISASPSAVNPGGTVSANFSGITGPSTSDWVGLYDSSSAADPALLAWTYTGGAANGSVNLTVPLSATPGTTYALRLFTNNSYVRLATSAQFSVVANATISASPASVADGSPVTATWSGIATPTATDWVGLYASSAAADPAVLAWAYTGGAAAGSLNLTVPVGSAADTTYELRLYSNNSYTRLATSGPISVT
jgi:ELWxxDGT repeat protein/VCBS repeat-containing protein